VTFSNSGKFRERVFETQTLTEITVRTEVTIHKEKIRRIANGQSGFTAVAKFKNVGTEEASYSKTSKDVLTEGQISRDFAQDTTQVVWRKSGKKPLTISASSTGLYVVSGSSNNPQVLRLTNSSKSWTHRNFSVSTVPSVLEKTGRINTRPGLKNSRYQDILNHFFD